MFYFGLLFLFKSRLICKGFLTNTKDCIDNKTVVRLLQDVHWGPDHVFNIDKHTLPLTYKFGLNLVFPFWVQ